MDLDHPRLLSPAASLASVRGRRRPALPRARREPGTRPARRSLRGGADGFLRRRTTRLGCGCSRSTETDGLRRMLTGVYETLRSAGRELVLELGERASLADRIDEFREAARCLAEDEGSGDAQRETARQAVAYLEPDATARPSLRPRRPEAARRAGRNVRRGAQARGAGGARRARRGRPRSAAGAARRLRRCVSGGRRTASRRSTSRICSCARAISCETTRRSASASSCASGRSWSTSSRTRIGCSAS